MATIRSLISVVLAALTALVGVGCGGPSHNDRPIAEWVLKQGGTVTVQGEDRESKELHALPPDGFVLEAINLNETDTGDEDLEKISGAKSLKVLALYNTNVTDDGLDHLVNIETLRELELSYTQIGDEGLDKLARLPNLQRLYLTGTRVTDEGLEGFRARRPSCKVFRF